MARKKLTPEQKAEKKALRAKRNFRNFETLITLMLIALSLACLIFIVSFGFGLNKTDNTDTDATNNTVSVNPDVQHSAGNNNATPDASTDNTVNSDASENQVESENQSEAENKEEAENQGEAENQNQAFKTPQEMVEYFNTSANKVKTDATEVVKNFEKRIVGELVVPSVLQSLAETLLKENMKDDTDPIVYSTKEEIRENFLVPAQDYVSCVTVDDIESISYEDKGSEYEFYIKLKDEKDPRAGSGVGSICDVIETYEVAEKAPSFLEEFSTSYYDCEVTATIDKETGRVTHIVYSTPLTLNVVANLFGTQTASVGFTFVKDYTITY